jgi:outer membrane protein OmpA-like peptidoglycan-associated protein
MWGRPDHADIQDSRWVEMLAPPPFATPPSPERLTQRVPFPRPDAHGIDPCAVAGEDAPAWLAVAFALAGTMIAIASAELSLQSVRVPLPAAPLAAVMVGPPQQSLERLLEPPPLPMPPQDSRPPEPRGASQQPADARPTPAVAISAVATEQPQASATSPEDKPVVAKPFEARPIIVPIEPSVSKPAPAECFQPLMIAFDNNSAQPNAGDVRRSFGLLQRWLSRHEDARVLIEGHSDATGTEDYNLLLSYARAKAIASELKRVGIPPGQIAVRAAGAGEMPAGARPSASERSAVLRIAGVEECSRLDATARKP